MRNVLHSLKYLALFWCIIALLHSPAQASAQQDTCEDEPLLHDGTIIDNLVEWIKQEGGIVDDRQQVKFRNQDDFLSPVSSVFATSTIPEGTVLLSVPWDAVLEPKNYSSREGLLCHMVNVLYKELQASKKGETKSDFKPFVTYLKTLTNPFVAPSGWSRGGKDLLAGILGDNNGMDAPYESWKRKCNIKGSIPKDLRTAALLVLNFASPNPSEDDQDWYHLVPFYDLYIPREDNANTKFVQDNKEQVMRLVAIRDIQSGEAIHTPMEYGEIVKDDQERQFIHSGVQEERYSLTFTDPVAPIVYQNLQVKFDLDRVTDENGQDLFNVSWVHGIRPHSRSYNYIEEELNRMKRTATLLPLDDLYLLYPTTTEYERRAINAYSSARMNALEAVLKTRHGARSVTPWTLQDHVVAGVNLGTYNLVGIEQDDNAGNGSVEPFQLFDNFDISDRIIGNENWWDMIEYRRHLDRSSLCFYVDKVARKRWLPKQGFSQAKQFVLKYGSELTETGSRDDEVEALYKQIPDEVDYAAKPSHHSEGVSVWLVSHDNETNVTSFSSTARQLMVDENKTFDKMNVARALSAQLHVEATDQESITLRNVMPGVVVEERFVEVDRYDRAPVEFNCFVIWGRLWIAQLNYIQKARRKAKTWLYRDGSPIEGKEKLPPELDYVDWPRVVEIAEALARNKDMFRVDIFVGLPASSPTLQANATREERDAAVEYAVNECEIYPTTNFKKWPQLAQDGARLWVAGYKIGNYRTIPNDEVPKEFVEKGYLPE